MIRPKSFKYWMTGMEMHILDSESNILPNELKTYMFGDYVIIRSNKIKYP